MVKIAWIYEDEANGCVTPKRVTTVIVRDGVSTIGTRAFRDCQNLVKVKIPNSVTKIQSNAFEWCKSLDSVILPSFLELIGNCAFNKCVSLKSLRLVQQQGQPTSTSKTTQPSSQLSIGTYAFSACTSLESVVIPSTVTIIRVGTFKGCKSLKTIYLPPTITWIGDFAFCDCTSLTYIELPPAVTHIGHCSFSRCTSLTSIKFPSSIKCIADYAFYACTSLSQIHLPFSFKHLDHSKVKIFQQMLLKNKLAQQSPCTPDSILPLHLFLMFGYVNFYEHKIDSLINTASSTLSICDPIFGFYPFLLAASTPGLNTTKSNGLCEIEHLETIYTLLRDTAWVMETLL